MEAPRYIISRNKIILVNYIYIYSLQNPLFLVARKKAYVVFKVTGFFQQGIWLWEITGKVQEIMGKLRVEIWKYLENQVFLKISFFFEILGKKERWFDFNPKKSGLRVP